jgi:hypothetical protein
MAYCYSFSGNSELQLRAEKIYGELIDADPNNVDALARLALIKRDAENLNEARLLMETALEEDMVQNPAEHRSQIRWLLCRDLAVLYWDIFRGDRTSHAAGDLLLRAIGLSEQARAAAPTDRQRLGATLNLLYYLAVQHSQASADAQDAIVARALPLLADVWSGDVPPDSLAPHMLDMLLHAERAFGEPERCTRLAGAVVQRLRAVRTGSESKPSEALRAMSAEEQDYYLFAMEVLATPERLP